MLRHKDVHDPIATDDTDMHIDGLLCVFLNYLKRVHVSWHIHTSYNYHASKLRANMSAHNLVMDPCWARFIRICRGKLEWHLTWSNSSFLGKLLVARSETTYAFPTQSVFQLPSSNQGKKKTVVDQKSSKKEYEAGPHDMALNQTRIINTPKLADRSPVMWAPQSSSNEVKVRAEDSGNKC